MSQKPIRQTIQKPFYALLVLAALATPATAMADNNKAGNWINPDLVTPHTRPHNNPHKDQYRYKDTREMVTRIYLNADLPPAFQRELAQAVEQHVRGPIRWVQHKHKADLVLDIREKHYDVDRRVINRTTETARYSGHRFRSTVAQYDVTTENFTVHYRYRLALKAKGPHSHGQSHKVWTVQGRADQRHSYAENLRVRTPNGWQHTDVAPTKRAAWLLDQNSPQARRNLRHQLRHEVGAQLAQQISHKTSSYLAHNSGTPYRPMPYQLSSNGWVR